MAKWKTCACPLWDERNIIDRPQFAAANVPAAQLPANDRAPPVAARPIQQALPGLFGQGAPAPVQHPAQPAFARPAQRPLGNGAFGGPAQPAFANAPFGAPAAAPFGNAQQGGLAVNDQSFVQAFAGFGQAFRDFGQNFAGIAQPAPPPAATAPPTTTAPPPPAATALPPPAQQSRPAQNRRNNRNHRRQQQAQQPSHHHDFQRYYRSEGWNTKCGKCGKEDRWVNCCSDCDLKVCWKCTRYRI